MRRAELDPDPVIQFQRWFAAAEAVVPMPNRVALATADGGPSIRMVLLKGVGEEGFDFYTNRDSRKARELAANPRAALCFHWVEPHHRQVRVEGAVIEIGDAESDAYFATRPRDSQLGAWASHQGAVLPDRAALEEALEEAERRFEGKPVPRPPHWGGYRLSPERIELWEGQAGRLHDRFRYELEPGGGWRIERLAP